jgi:uncharacterized protein YmfQ (DUF2313 family)
VGVSDIPSGWPCAGLPANPPSVVDLEAQPTADTLLPQVLALTPRGVAWGTDEVGDGTGASPVLRRFWRGIAAFAADHLGLDWQAATQTFPSAVTYTLPDWERELGLPGPCGTGEGGAPARQAAVRAHFAALGGQSPAYMVCVAAAVGYAITIEEPTQFFVEESECVGADPLEVWFYADGGDGNALDSYDLAEIYALCDDATCDDTLIEAFVLAGLGDGDPLEALVLSPAPDAAGDQVAGGLIESYGLCDDAACDDTPVESADDDPNGTVWRFWVVHVASVGDTWFTPDSSECDFDPVEGFVPAPDLECLLRGICPPHTQLVFDYAAAA